MKKTSMKKRNTVSIPDVKIKKPAVHFTDQYLINPGHPVTIHVIGCGGTGSQVINSLARMSSALRSLGHPGFFVRAIDADKVSDTNVGRQLFSPADIGAHKATVLIGRINRFFGYDWESVPEMYTSTGYRKTANITISCVDSGRARKEIKVVLTEAAKGRVDEKDLHTRNYRYFNGRYDYEQPYYWMDFGNMKDRGQCVIGSLGKIKQPASNEYDSLDFLPTIDKLHPDILVDKKGDDQGPSCSLAEALQKQDLFINTNLANMGLGILWKMFRELHIKYHGCYLNLDTLSVNPIKIA